tara:strand:+ start:208 stop:726 length:519 start_codon:yes stop_codon:yes gene_type:complete
MKITESKINAHSGTSFNVTKTAGVSKIDFGGNKWIENADYYGEILLGDCKNCTKINALYDGLSFDKILIGGLGLGLLPEYAKSVKNCSVIDVIENNKELIDYIDFIDSDINVIEGDMYTYNSNKKYDIIVVDLWWYENEITEQNKSDLLANWSDNLNAGGKIILPIAVMSLN